MSTKPNYFKLGLFILIALFLLVLGIVLFGSGVFAKEKTFFESYFADPVAGLVPGSPVLEQGVQIGVVESISFVRHDYPFPEVTSTSSPYRPWVRVICSIRSGRLPEAEKEKNQEHLDSLIKHGLRLQLSTNILTGQGYIEAGYRNPARFPVSELPWIPEYLYIPSAPSDFTTMKDSVDKILQRLEQIETEKIAKNVNKVLLSVNEAVNDAEIKTLRTEAGKLLAETRQTNQALKQLLENPNPQQDLSNIAVMVDQLDRTMVYIDQLIRTQSPQLVEMIENLNQITDNLKGLTEDLKRNPSMIFSEPPKRREASK
jgi:paraquat-inducible protein B